MRCHNHDLELSSTEQFLEHVLQYHLYRLEDLMSEMSDDQKHLEADVESLQASWAYEVAALKAQIAANPTVMAAHLDFTSIDALTGAEQAATTVTPSQTSSDDPSLADTNTPAPIAIGPTAASPFVAPAEDDELPEPEATEDPTTPATEDPATTSTEDPATEDAPTS